MEKRDEYLEKINAQIEQCNVKLMRMRGKATEVHADMKLEYLKQVDKIESKREDLNEKYEQLKKSNENSWEDIKEGTEKAFNELKESFTKATKHFK